MVYADKISVIFFAPATALGIAFGPRTHTGKTTVMIKRLRATPNITFQGWANAAVPDAAQNQVKFGRGDYNAAGTPTAPPAGESFNAYLLRTQSKSGAHFTYLRDNNAKTERCKSTTGWTPSFLGTVAACPSGSSSW